MNIGIENIENAPKIRYSVLIIIICLIIGISAWWVHENNMPSCGIKILDVTVEGEITYAHYITIKNTGKTSWACLDLYIEINGWFQQHACPQEIIHSNEIVVITISNLPGDGPKTLIITTPCGASDTYEYVIE